MAVAQGMGGGQPGWDVYGPRDSRRAHRAPRDIDARSCRDVFHGCGAIPAADHAHRLVGSTPREACTHGLALVKTVFVQEIVPSYRIPFFAGLAAFPGIELTVISGAVRRDEGFGVVSPAE